MLSCACGQLPATALEKVDGDWSRRADPEPNQRKQYLGTVLDSVRPMVLPLPERVSQFQSVAQSFLEDRAPTMSLWRSLLGYLASLERLVPGGQVRSQSLQWCLNKH
ncbi:hypothetical protein E2C01_048642 [Portunus trituberculatus]|uniref:Uncharacterized protein n=1 Tax=Portunus trituberculatus TaxID=210409 RepID=A0A5B7GBI2_PORTR|nr:hypothetical protein [Portunus trituberculatus]